MDPDQKLTEDIVLIGKAVCETRGWVDARDIYIVLTGDRITVREKQISISRISSVLRRNREFIPLPRKHGKRTAYTLRRNCAK